MVAVTALCLASNAALATVINVGNVLVNADAEAGAGGDGSTIVAVPGWTTSGNFTVVDYAAGVPGGWPDPATDPVPPDRGENFFSGGPGNAFSSATQVIGASDDAALIDTGVVTYALSGWLGGFASQNDNAVLTATFLDSASTPLAVASIGPVTAAERGNQSGFLLRSTSGLVPVGTREIGILLEMTRAAGVFNDGYADSLSLTLTEPGGSVPIPEPSALALVGIGLLGIGFGRRCRAP